MKKQYISPEMSSQKLHLDSLLNSASIETVESVGLTNSIEIGGDAADGVTSDSRRSVWDDEELNDEEDY